MPYYIKRKLAGASPRFVPCQQKNSIKCAASDTRPPCGASAMNFFSAEFASLAVARGFVECTDASALDFCQTQLSCFTSSIK